MNEWKKNVYKSENYWYIGRKKWDNCTHTLVMYAVKILHRSASKGTGFKELKNGTIAYKKCFNFIEYTVLLIT